VNEAMKTLRATGRFVLKYNTAFMFAVLLIASAIASDRFLIPENIFNLLRQKAGIGITSMGMLLVILTAGIDLSVGSILALSSVLSAYFLLSMPLPAALPLTILAGVVLGGVSGFLVSNRRMAPFVVTLAMMTIARGLAYIVSKGAPILLTDSGEALKNFGTGYCLGIPQPVILMFAVFLLIFLILKFTLAGWLWASAATRQR